MENEEKEPEVEKLASEAVRETSPTISTAAHTNAPVDGQAVVETSNSVEELAIGAVTTEEISSPGLPASSHPNDVKFKVSYPKDYKGSKDMPDGSIQVVAKETAEHFQSIKIGRIVK